MKAVVLAGGKGARLAPYTKILPKPLMPIGDMPILEIMLRQMKRCCVNEVVLTVGHLASLLATFFQDGSRLGMKISYVYEDHPLGTAAPIANVEGLDETFLVTNGDVLTTLSFPDLLRFHQEKGGIATIAAHTRTVKIDFGVLQAGEDNVLTGYIEKPTYNFLVSMGVYVFEPRVLQYIPKNEYLDLPNLVLKLMEAGEQVNTYPFNGYWMDLGRVSDYEQAIQDFDEIKPLLFGDQPVENTPPVDLAAIFDITI